MSSVSSIRTLSIITLPDMLPTETLSTEDRKTRVAWENVDLGNQYQSARFSVYSTYVVSLSDDESSSHTSREGSLEDPTPEDVEEVIRRTDSENFRPTYIIYTDENDDGDVLSSHNGSRDSGEDDDRGTQSIGSTGAIRNDPVNTCCCTVS